ncbi:TetR/AcrR family transcriptional regulator [Nonomuraea sp. NPDC050663]|uniref:TetR/AcrR family transcriptional regulator n=1 Tax=Nonomuraea sp. NPDC050663 TaxID=3364370 RepID=UPI00379ABC33
MSKLWEAPPSRERPVLSVPVIARAAIELADQEGIDALSMQRVAAVLGFTKMALYRHVSDKAELLAVMVDVAVGEPPQLGAGDWRARLESFLAALSAVWERHPWLPWVTLGDRMMGPREMAWVECALTALDDTGLSGVEKMDAVTLLFGHIRNTQSSGTAGTQPWAEDHQVREPYKELLERHGDRFPALSATLAGIGDAPGDFGRRFGLDCILDGLAVRIGRAASGA